ncbi:MAG: hypothetical protein ACE5KL_07745, partial [Alphaproteobacteria bacterium]
AEAKRKCRLDREDIRMAKEMGLNPRSLIKNIPAKSEPWKLPVKEWIREMYRKREEKAANKKARTRESAATSPVLVDQVSALKDTTAAAEIPAEGVDFFDDEFALEDHWEADEDPALSWQDDALIGKEIDEQNQAMLRLRENYRLAADYVARALARVPDVRKVVLFGSVAVPLKKEIPRFRKFRRAGVAIWHECKDVDLAVWVTSCSTLRKLQNARSAALNALYRERGIGVAHHQVEIFLMEPDTNRYLGRLCIFGQCPKAKVECRVPGCGASPFLRQHEGFVLHPSAFDADKTVILFERTAMQPLDQDSSH